jgi:hypothetical protein
MRENTGTWRDVVTNLAYSYRLCRTMRDELITSGTD